MTDGGPLPFRPDVETGESAPRVVDLDDEAAARVLDALSAGTARQIYRSLREDPATPPELADRLDCSLQNVHYHLRNLDDADLVEPAGTGYSEKGVEMTVYAPADRPLVLTTADEETGSRLRRFLGRILGAVAGLGVASLLVQWTLGGPAGEGGGPAGGTNMTGPINGSGVTAAPVGPPPGLLFFAGGVLALAVVAGVWYWTTGRG